MRRSLFESFAQAFSKACRSRRDRRSPPQRRNIPFGVFFFAKLFSLRLLPQRKKRIKTEEKHRIERGPPHLCGSPNPSVALFKAGGISPSAEGDQRTRAGAAVAFCKKRRKNLWSLRAKVFDKSKFERQNKTFPKQKASGKRKIL